MGTFHVILQQSIAKNGITNSTVKALLFEAMESFQKEESLIVNDTIVESIKKLSEPSDNSLFTIESVSESVGSDLPSEPIIVPDTQESSLLVSSPKINSVSIHAESSASVRANRHKLENPLQMITLSKVQSPNNVFNQAIQSLLFFDSIFDEKIKDVSKLTPSAPMPHRLCNYIHVNRLAKAA